MGRYGERGSRNQSHTPLRRDGTSSALSSAVPHPCKSTSVAHTRMRAGSSGAAGSSSPPRRAADARESKDSPSPPESISSARKRWSFGACSQEERCEETPFTARRGRGGASAPAHRRRGVKRRRSQYGEEEVEPRRLFTGGEV